MAVAPVQRRSKETYRTILHAASRLLEREGVAQMTIQKVAEAAGVDARLVRYYFDDLEGLLQVISDLTIARWTAMLRTMLSGRTDPRETIAEVLGESFANMVKADQYTRRQALVVQEIRVWSLREEALRPLPARLHSALESAWVEVFESALDRFAFAVEPAVLARMIYDSYDGVALDWLTTGDTASARAALDGLVKAFVGLITPR